MESFLRVLESPAIPALIGVAAGVFIAYLSCRWGLAAQLKIGDHQKRQQVFSELTGQKSLFMQLMVSRFEALIYSDYHEAKWKLAGAPKDSLDLEEARRWMHKSEDLALDVAKNRKSLCETIGLIRILFANTVELDKLTDRIFRFKMPQIGGEPSKMNQAQLESWKAQAVTALQRLVETEYGESIDELLGYLDVEIHKHG